MLNGQHPIASPAPRLHARALLPGTPRQMAGASPSWNSVFVAMPNLMKRGLPLDSWTLPPLTIKASFSGQDQNPSSSNSPTQAGVQQPGNCRRGTADVPHAPPNKGPAGRTGECAAAGHAATRCMPWAGPQHCPWHEKNAGLGMAAYVSEGAEFTRQPHTAVMHGGGAAAAC